MSRSRAGRLAWLLLCCAGCGSAREPEQLAERSPAVAASAPEATRATAHAPVSRHDAPSASAPQAPAGNTRSAGPTAARPTPSTALATPAAAPAPESNAVERALAYDPADALAELESADALDRMGGSAPSAPASQRAAPGTCVVLTAAQRVWPTPTPPAIASVGPGFVVAGYSAQDGGERLFVVRTAPGSRPEPITAFALQSAAHQPRKLAPALAARDENDVAVAFVDGDNRLWVRRLRLSRAGHGAPIQVATGLDPRFAPALTHHADRTLVAWTVGSTPMHTQLAAISSEDSVLTHTDVTPSAMGAAAPTFVSGAPAPVLIAIDARNGMSSILRVTLAQADTPLPAQIAAPVGMVSTPPQLAAAAGQDTTWIAFAGLGPAATSAIGLIALAPPGSTARTLVPGIAYGPLHVSAVATAHAVIVAADAAASPGKDARREIHVHVVHAGAIGPAAVIKGPAGASHAAVAYASRDEVAVAYSSATGVYVAYLRCNDAER